MAPWKRPALQPSAAPTHAYVDDPRNATILISVNGELVPRAEATVSVFDSGFVLGDGVWEGLRVLDGGIGFLDQHLDRLYEGAHALRIDIGLTPAELTARLFDLPRGERHDATASTSG